MADATPLIDDWEIKDADKTKKGRKFFGCCCDSRRAVIVTNILDIILCIILYICSAFQTSLSGLQITVWVVNQIWNTATILGAFYYSDIIVIMGVLWQLFKMSAIIYHFAEYYAPMEERLDETSCRKKRTKKENGILAVASDSASAIAACSTMY
eukprot:scaffold27070_cov147-Skeletonema_menzelii.AAC.4